MATKRYAFENYGGQIMSIETRCSGRYKEDVADGELALEQIIHPDMLQYYIEITDVTGDAQPGYIWSDGKFSLPSTVPELAQQQITALQVATDTQPIDTSTLEGAQKAKIRELSNACHKAIYAGADATTSKGTEHFSLTDNDQINLSSSMEQVKGGAAQVPYHADGQLCRMFTAEEMTGAYQAAVQYIAYNTTLCNHLLTWVRRCTTVVDVNAITYTSSLPDDLKKNMNMILGGAAT